MDGAARAGQRRRPGMNGVIWAGQKWEEQKQMGVVSAAPKWMGHQRWAKMGGAKTNRSVERVGPV